MVIHRDAILRIMNAMKRTDPAMPWFGYDQIKYVQGSNVVFKTLGEDLTFCRRLRSPGIPILAMPTYTGHIKEHRFSVDRTPPTVSDVGIMSGASMCTLPVAEAQRLGLMKIPDGAW